MLIQIADAFKYMDHKARISWPNIVWSCLYEKVVAFPENHFNITGRHNERHGVSNHRHIDCLFTVCSGAYYRKYQSSASLDFVRGIYRRPVDSPHKGPVTRIMFPFDAVIMTICAIMTVNANIIIWCPNTKTLPIGSIMICTKNDGLTWNYQMKWKPPMQLILILFEEK